MVRRGLARLAGVLAVAAAAAACGPSGPRPDAEGLAPPGRSELVDRVRERAKGVETLRAGLELAWFGADGAAPEGCSASLVYQRGGRLRLEARSAAFFTIFEMVAGADSTWIDVPRERVRIAGARRDSGWAGLPIDPERMLVALLADPWGGAPPPEAEAELARGPDGPVLRGEGWTLRLDGAGRPQVYNGGAWTISWSEWTLRRGIDWPHRIEIAGGEGVLRVRLGQLIPDRNLPRTTFAPPADPDRTVLTPIKANEWWRGAFRGSE
ncbi:MAG: hypothetical protein ACT4PE_07755 [Candidatus Eiseniibacteriota bacterium]